MNDYDLFMRCKTMIERDGYDEDAVAGRYVKFAVRHMRNTKGHEWMGDELESLDWKKNYRAIPGSIVKISNIDQLYNNNDLALGRYSQIRSVTDYLTGGLRF